MNVQPTACILAATDFSPRSAQVAGRAAALARQFGARLILAHVLPVAAAPRKSLAVTGRLRMRPLLSRLGLAGRAMTPSVARDRLQALAATLPVPAEIRVLQGKAESVLAACVAELGADLLVLGLHRERRVLDALRLTTMERIVLAAPVPVLIAHQPSGQAYRQVLALTDFSPGSAAALRMAVRLAPEARFHAVCALPPSLPLVTAVAGADTPPDDTLTRAEMMRAAFLALPGLPDFVAPPVLVPGGVHEVLEFRRAELGADLICIGTHSGREPGRLGHYARDLMRAPPADLLIAKPDH